jgi:hypothetical protein
MKAVMVTRSEKRRAIIIDLLIGIGIPILQMIAREYRPFALNQSLMLTRCRLHCVWTSFQLIRGFRPLIRSCAYAADFLPHLRMAPCHRLRIPRLLW